MNKHLMSNTKVMAPVHPTMPATSVLNGFLGNYSISLEKHNIRAMVGYSYQYWQNPASSCERTKTSPTTVSAPTISAPATG